MRRGRAKPGGRRPAGASPASGRSQRPPQPCGPGSRPAAATCLGPELRGGAGRGSATASEAQAVARCDPEPQPGRCCAARICFRVAGQVVRGVPSQQLRLPALVWRPSYSAPLVGPGGSCPA